MNQGLVGFPSASAQARIVDIPLVIGTRGIPLAVNDHVFLRLSLGGVMSIRSWSLASTIAGVSASGTITLDVQTGPTLAGVASICGANKPTLTAQAELDEQIPTGWNPLLTDPTWLLATVTSTANTLEVVSLTLRCSL